MLSPELNPKLAAREILIDFSGPVAEEIMTGSVDQASLDSDAIHAGGAFDIAITLCGDEEQVSAYLDELMAITHDTFTLPSVKAAVHALAQRLLQRDLISGYDAVRVIREAL